MLVYWGNLTTEQTEQAENLVKKSPTYAFFSVCSACSVVILKTNF